MTDGPNVLFQVEVMTPIVLTMNQEKPIINEVFRRPKILTQVLTKTNETHAVDLSIKQSQSPSVIVEETLTDDAAQKLRVATSPSKMFEKINHLLLKLVLSLLSSRSRSCQLS